MARIGTRFTDDRKNLSYSVEQTAALTNVNDDRYALYIAKREYVNHVLHADGEIDTDLAGVRKAISGAFTIHDKAIAEAKAAVAKERKALTTATKATKPGVRERMRQALAALTQANAAAVAAETLGDEFDEHVDQERFLFVLSDHGLPVVYYQCATPDNPDLPPLAGAKAAPTSPGKPAKRKR